MYSSSQVLLISATKHDLPYMEMSGIKSVFIGIFTEVSHNGMYCCIFTRIQKNKKGVIYLGIQKTCRWEQSDGFLYMFYWKKQVEAKPIHKKQTIQKPHQTWTYQLLLNSSEKQLMLYGTIRIFLGRYYLRILFKSIFLYSVVFLLESPHMKLHKDR